MFDLHSDVDSLLEMALPSRLSWVSRASGPHTAQPSYRMTSDSSGATIQVELPGVAAQDIDIQAVDRAIEISAKRFDADVDNNADPDAESKDPSAPSPNNDKKTPQPATQVVDEHQEDQPAQAEADTQCEAHPPPSDRKPLVHYKLRLHLDHHYDRDRTVCRSHADGVLTLHVPKMQQQAPRRIAVC